jgi:hypothetical protein
MKNDGLVTIDVVTVIRMTAVTLVLVFSTVAAVC